MRVNGILNLVLLELNALVLKRQMLINRIENKPAAGVHALGKHPLLHPSPKCPLDTTALTPCQKDLGLTHCQLLKTTI